MKIGLNALADASGLKPDSTGRWPIERTNEHAHPVAALLPAISRDADGQVERTGYPHVEQ